MSHPTQEFLHRLHQPPPFFLHNLFPGVTVKLLSNDTITDMIPDDVELIKKAQVGDMVAFEQLVHRHDKQVLVIAARYVTSAEDAKDIYQDVFIKVYRGLKKFKFKSEFGTWLYRITTNTCLTHHARQKKRTFVPLHGEGDGDDPGYHDALTEETAADQHALDADISTHVREALDTLPARQKMVFTLRHYHGYKLKEIAEMMECAEGTVKRYLFTATQRMREQLKEVF